MGSLSHSSSGASTLGTGTIAITGVMSVSAGSLTQSGSGPTQSAGSISVTGGSLVWGAGNLTVAGGIAQSAGTLNLGSKAVTATTLSVNGGSLALGTATLALSSAPNVITGTTSITDTSSTITLNAAGNLTLDSVNTIGNLVVAANTALVGGGRAKNLTINLGIILDLDAVSNAVSLAILAGDTLTATGTLRVFDSTNAVSLVSQTAGTTFTYTGTDIAYNGKALTIDDMNASSLATTIGGRRVGDSRKLRRFFGSDGYWGDVQFNSSRRSVALMWRFRRSVWNGHQCSWSEYNNRVRHCDNIGLLR